MKISIETIMVTVVGALLGGSGVVGFVFAYMRRFIDKKLDARDKENQRSLKHKIERLRLDNELSDATGKVIYQLHRAVITEHPNNNELEEAWTNYQDVLKKKEDYDRSILIGSIIDEM